MIYWSIKKSRSERLNQGQRTVLKSEEGKSCGVAVSYKVF